MVAHGIASLASSIGGAASPASPLTGSLPIISSVTQGDPVYVNAAAQEVIGVAEFTRIRQEKIVQGASSQRIVEVARP